LRIAKTPAGRLLANSIVVKLSRNCKPFSRICACQNRKRGLCFGQNFVFEALRALEAFERSGFAPCKIALSLPLIAIYGMLHNPRKFCHCMCAKDLYNKIILPEREPHRQNRERSLSP